MKQVLLPLFVLSILLVGCSSSKKDGTSIMQPPETIPTVERSNASLHSVSSSSAFSIRTFGTY